MGSPLWPRPGQACTGVAPHRIMNSLIKVHVARCLARPSGRNEDHGAQLSPVGRRTSSERQGGPGCCAQHFCGAFFFASLVLQEQLLRDPTHSYTWLPPSLPQGLPRGGAGEKGLGNGAPRITLVPPHLSTWQRQAPTSETREGDWIREATLPRRSPKMTQSQALGCGARAGLLEI